MTKKKKLQIRNSTAEFLIFTNQAKEDGIEVRVQDETIWLSQKLMGALFDCSTDNISLHLKNIFKENELDENSVTEEFSVTASDGKNYKTKHYNLDAIISVGYRVNTKRATAFRQWATYVLRDYAIRGYVIDKKRMENGTFLGEDYFEHLLAEIREIRLSERRFYQKITDIYATAMDYNKDAVITKEFFSKVQNKLHYAVHGRTAAELIMSRANAGKEHMGLTSWEKSPDGKVVKTDVSVVKNYLTETELESLGRIVNAYLDLAEDRAKRHLPMTMEDWAKRLDRFLEADDRDILQNSGKITALMAKSFAESEFEKYRVVQDSLFESDFDKEIKRIDRRRNNLNIKRPKGHKKEMKMNTDKIENVLSENLGEGYRIVRDNGELSPIIEWVDWVPQSDDEEDIKVEVHFEDETDEVFEKGVALRQIWHEDVE